ncbi:MAG: hypothetical protein D6806_14415 [Deltaproteobacteria bacterium]|nr:MAG: hypothetical protein D6806_14415 [Deltaproteobacteria bacterium]
MTGTDQPNGLSNQPPPELPSDKKTWWRKPFTVIASVIGLVASASTVVGLVQGWFDPKPDPVEKLEQIEKKIDRVDQDGELVNQVSRRVTEFADRFKIISANMKDIRRLARSLEQGTKAAGILTPEQRKLRKAARRKEREELLRLVATSEKMARDFCASVEGDDTLGKVESEEGRAAQDKARALKQAQKVKSEYLPELIELRKAYSN